MGRTGRGGRGGRRAPSEEARGWLDRYPIGRVLTDRQAQVVRLLAAGKPPDEVAAELGISVPTVRTHLQLVRARLQGYAARRAREA